MRQTPTIAGVAAVLALSAAGAAEAATDWSGVYWGVHDAYSWGHSSGNYDDPSIAGLTGPLVTNPKGWSGGAQLGINFASLGPWVLGLETDASWGSAEDTIPDILGDLHDPPGPYTITGSSDFYGTVRARIGVALGTVMPYATGGFAWAHTTVSSTDGPVSDSATLTGWTAGGGFEIAVAPRVSAKVEYLYADFGKHTYFQGEAYSSTIRSTSNTVTVGLNFYF